jgi:hypothetical protein
VPLAGPFSDPGKGFIEPASLSFAAYSLRPSGEHEKLLIDVVNVLAGSIPMGPLPTWSANVIRSDICPTLSAN